MQIKQKSSSMAPSQVDSAPGSNKAALNFLKFSDSSPTPFHAVSVAAAKLEAAGFIKISEKESWTGLLKAGSNYYYTRNGSAIVAFSLPSDYKSGNAVSLIATHLDSCVLKVRPVSKKVTGEWLQLACETYGGGLWHTWFDRDLSLAGRVIVSTPNGFQAKLIKINRPILRIPNLAIHLTTGGGGFAPNKEMEMYPVLGLVGNILNKEGSAPTLALKESAVGAPDMKSKHLPEVLSLIATELACSVDDIYDFELTLFDTQPASLGGLNDELIFAPRMDNQMSSFCAIEAMSESVTSPSTSNLNTTSARAIFLFDHEEVGSTSNHGANSNLMPSLISRLTAAGIGASSSAPPPTVEEVLAKSFLLSADMTHALHPNYPQGHQELHQPLLNHGVTIKTNASQSYTSNSQTTFLIRRIAKFAGVPLQEYEVRNDMSCGSTVGPGLSKNIRTVDVGIPELSMHSIREMAGVYDVPQYIKLFKTFLERFGDVDRELDIDA